MTAPSQASSPKFFKGIALFTPGGDLVYCIDPEKQGRWHLHLCAFLQELLGLSEPPHFLVPCYTATIDRWFDPRTQAVKISAEAYRPVLQYQTLLNAIFATTGLTWEPAPWPEKLCNPLVLATYYEQFPQLWQGHDLVARLDQPGVYFFSSSEPKPLLDPVPLLQPEETPDGYVLRLFVSGHGTATEKILQRLHQILENQLHHPYTLNVIDIFKHPEQAELNRVSATPTLVRVWPRPIRRIVGKLNDEEQVLHVLGLGPSH